MAKKSKSRLPDFHLREAIDEALAPLHHPPFLRELIVWGLEVMLVAWPLGKAPVYRGLHRVASVLVQVINLYNAFHRTPGIPLSGEEGAARVLKLSNQGVYAVAEHAGCTVQQIREAANIDELLQFNQKLRIAVNDLNKLLAVDASLKALRFKWPRARQRVS